MAVGLITITQAVPAEAMPNASVIYNSWTKTSQSQTSALSISTRCFIANDAQWRFCHVCLSRQLECSTVSDVLHCDDRSPRLSRCKHAEPYSLLPQMQWPSCFKNKDNEMRLLQMTKQSKLIIFTLFMYIPSLIVNNSSKPNNNSLL